MFLKFTRRRWSTALSLLTAVLLLIGSAPVFAFPPPGGSAPEKSPAHNSSLDALKSKVQVELLNDLSLRNKADLWVVLGDSPDLSAARNMGWDEKGQYIYEQLIQNMETSQAPVAAYLDNAGAKYEQFWISNTIYVKDGSLDLVTGLASLAEVSEIIADGSNPLVEPEPGEAQPAMGHIEWGVADINAPQLWAEEVTGEGIVIGSIDSGVLYNHPALVNSYRGNKGSGNFDHNYSWYDPSNVCRGGEPCDFSGHGTHTAGTMVGDDGGTNKIGVAPGAKWIASMGCEGQTCSDYALLASMQFMLAPTDVHGGNPRPDLRPHVVNNSWGGAVSDVNKQEAVQAWVAAGMFPVFANGNDGPACGTVGSPASFPESYGVGNYTSTYSISSTSSRGPSPVGGDIVKPDISAPGTDIRSAWNDEGYAIVSGTSMAAPHVAGAVALLWSSTDMVGDVDGTRHVLGTAAIPVTDLTCGGASDFNNVWGRGRLDVLAAFQVAQDIQLAEVTGNVSDANDGDPIAGAFVVAFEGDTVARTVRTGEDGSYRLRVPLGSYTVQVSMEHYVTEERPVELSADGEQVEFDFELDTARVSAEPESLFFEMYPDEYGEQTLHLSNDGRIAAEFLISSRASLRARSGIASEAEASEDPISAVQGTGDVGVTAEGLSRSELWSPAGEAEERPVLEEWDTGLVIPWGVGYDGDVIISNPGIGGGDNYNHKFTPDGLPITEWSTGTWHGDWAGDMAYDDNHHLLWQVAVGGDNCIYGQDPDTGLELEKICGTPWTRISQRGLAYRSHDDTFYVGGWNENIIYHIKGLSHDHPGEVIEQQQFSHGRSVSGLAWNDTAKVLWIATSSPESYIYAQSPGDDWETVKIIQHPENQPYVGAGLSLDEYGNLWMVSSPHRKAYLVDSGIPANPPDRSWLSVDIEEGSIEPGSYEDLTVSVSSGNIQPGVYSGSVVIRSNSGRSVRRVVPVTLNILMRDAGWLEGYVYDDNDKGPVADALVESEDASGEALYSTRTDGDGYFRFQLPLGEHTVTARARRYATNTKEVKFDFDGEEAEVGFYLPTGKGSISPDEVALTLEAGSTATEVLTISNSGGQPMAWRLRQRPSLTGGEADSGALQPSFAGDSLITRADHKREPGYDVFANTTEGMFVDGGPQHAPARQGQVLKTWAAGIPFPWGVGFDDDLILSNPAVGGGDNRNYRLSVDGELIDRWSTVDWHGDWAADMTYDRNHDLIWQVAVGGGNCLHGLNPDTGKAEQVICGAPWSGVPQRGVSYRPDDDTFYIGGWVEDVIYRIRGLSHNEPGQVIEQVPFAPGQLSGLAWNETAEILWAATNSSYSNVYALHPESDWAIVGSVGHPAGGGHHGAGLSIDHDGNLWMVSIKEAMVYLVDSGYPHFGPVDWLEADVLSGTLDPGESAEVQISVYGFMLDPGSHEATVYVETDSGRSHLLATHITAHVTPADAVGIAGTVIDANDREPVAGAEVTVFASNGAAVASTKTGTDGSYDLAVYPGDYTIAASADRYSGDSVPVIVGSGEGPVLQNFQLETALAVVSPSAMEFSVGQGEQAVKELTVINEGTQPVNWSITPQGIIPSPDGGNISSGEGGPEDSYVYGVPGRSGASLDEHATTARGAGRSEMPADAPASPGTVLKEWISPVGNPWGVGFDGDLILSMPAVLGGDDKDYKFTVDGEYITEWSTAEWQGHFAADIAFDSRHHIVWQIASGGDNCIHGLDPHDGTHLETICGHWIHHSQRGLAYRPDSDTFYMGGWNENLIYEINGLSHPEPGKIIQQRRFSADGRGLSGLAWNETAGILWAATNSHDDRLYAFAPEEGWAEVAQLAHPDPGYNGAGLAADYEGNLWMVSQTTGKVYLVDSGIPAAAAGWLKTDDRSGTVQPGESVTVRVYVDAFHLEAGEHGALLKIETDSGREPELTVGITAYVTAANFSTLSGIVTDGNDGGGVLRAKVSVERDDGTRLKTVLTDAEGRYVMELPAGEYAMTATARNYGSDAAPLTLHPGGGSHELNFVLPAGRGETDADRLEFSLVEGHTETQVIQLENTGGRTLAWSHGITAGWLDLHPSSGQLEVNETTAIEVIVDASDLEPGIFETTLELVTDGGRHPVVTVDVSAEILMGAAGYVTGVITDQNDGEPIEGATVTAFDSEGQYADSADTDAEGRYTLLLRLGEYELRGEADDYSSSTVAVAVIEEGEQYERDLQLATGLAELEATVVEFTIPAGGSAAKEVTINNVGGRELSWALLGARPAGTPGGLGTATWADGIYGTAVGTGSAAGAVAGGSAGGLTPGDVLKSWDTGLTIPYGLGFDGHVIISNPGPLGGDDHNHKFTPDGDFVTKWATTGWHDYGALDMTFDSIHGLIWQVASTVSDSCIYGLDPDDGTVEETLCGTPWGRNPLGIAHNPTDDTFYIFPSGRHRLYQVGGLSHEAPGQVIDDVYHRYPGSSITGMTWNPTARVLWISTLGRNSKVYALSPEDEWAEVAEVPHPAGANGGTGLAMDGEGNLWTVSMQTSKAYLIYSGIPHYSLAWMSVDPDEGTIGARDSETVTVSVDAATLEVGTHEAEILLETDAGRDPKDLAIPVIVHVVEPGAIDLIVAEPEHETYTNADFITVAGTAIDPAGGDVTVTVNGDETPVDVNGSFTFVELLPEEDGAYDIVVTAVGENGGEATEARTVYVDRTDPVIDEDSVEPAEDVELAPGESVTIGFTGEPGLRAGYTVLASGADGGSLAAGSVPGTPVDEVDEGVYEAVYTAPADAQFENAAIEFHIADAAGNTITVQAPGLLAVRPSYTAPEVEITEPEEGYLTNSQAVRISGVATDGQGIEKVTIDGRTVPVDDEGGFTGRALLDEGANVIAVTATNVVGLETTATVTVIADWTAPELEGINPAADVVLEWGDELEISFTSEAGLTAAYQLIVSGTTASDGAASSGERTLVRGVPFEEVAEGVYKAVYTAPEASFENAEIQINAMDPAGNKTHVTAPGGVTVIPAAEPVGPPKLVITEPEAGMLTNRGAVRVSGTATDDQPGQSVEEVTVNGRRVTVEGDGSFTTRIALVEGSNVITVTAVNTAGEKATETVTITADWTPPELANMEPAEDVTLVGGQSYTVRFTSEPGLTAAFQVLMGGQRGKWHGKDIPVRGIAMVEVADGVYEGTYTAPAGSAFVKAIVQFNAADAAGNVTMVTAPGSITVVKE